MKADRFVFFVAVFGVAFLFGQWSEQSKPKVCPEVKGQAVVSTHSTTHGEFCTYSMATGFATRKVKL